MLTILREQLASKDQQIRTLETQLDRKDEQIASLNERMRESNVLMRELQQRLAIAPPKGVGESLLHAPPVTTGGGGTSPSLSSAKHSKSKPIAVNSSAAKKKPVKPKPGFFTRFFGTAK
jgi:ATP-dependent 26S proteasome regulatory subunit